MQIRRSVIAGSNVAGSATGIEVLAPAKINLFFEVLARRSDGMHEIETLMVPIDLYDTLHLADDPSGQLLLTATWAADTAQPTEYTVRSTEDMGDLPDGDANIAGRAVRLLAAKSGLRRGAKILLTKRIPSAAGLGGGSSDAAAALVAANEAWDLGWSNEQLAEVAAELGSDVPFFFAGGPAVCRGRGEKIETLNGLPTLHLVVVRPPEGLATAAVYRACTPGNPPLPVMPVVAAWQRGDLSALGPVAHNRLLEPARELSPWVGRVLDLLAMEGCPAIGMSGSGTSCFAVCRDARQAQALAARLRPQNIGRVWAVQTV